MNSTENMFLSRFHGIGRLYGMSALDTLKQSHVLIVGLGGVGTWAAEALVRSGLGEVTLVDADEICVTNTNRQLVALTNTVGKFKIDILKERLLLINPELKVNLIYDFFTKSNAEEILSINYSYVVDAIDSLQFKCHLIAQAQKKNIPVITCGGSAGRRDPTKIKLTDLGEAYNDKLLMRLRKKLRNDYAYPEGKNIIFNVDCVFSWEKPFFPTKEGGICRTLNPEENQKQDCDTGMGSATFITGTFGFIAASKIVENLSQKPIL